MSRKSGPGVFQEFVGAFGQVAKFGGIWRLPNYWWNIRILLSTIINIYLFLLSTSAPKVQMKMFCSENSGENLQLEIYLLTSGVAADVQ